MEYENIKHLQKKKEEFMADTDATDASSQHAQQIDIHMERANSFSSSHSASYQIFYPEDSTETYLEESSLQEHQEESLTPDSATYSHPQPVRLRSPDGEENEEGYAKNHISSDENVVSQSIYQVPNASTVTQPLAVELPPRNSTATVPIDSSSRESTIQASDGATTSNLARRISDSSVAVQHATGHPVAKNSLSVSSNGRGGNGFQTECASVVAKPLIMKVLPLYLCMDDGKVYADQNAASIPTHHLVEVKGLEKSIVLQEINRLPPIPPPIVSKKIDHLTHPNPVYEIVPRDLATRSNIKAAVVTDQPRIQSSQSLPSETPPLPIQEPSRSRASDTTPPATTSLSNAKSNNDQEDTATQSNFSVTAPALLHSDHKAIHSAREPSQALLTDTISPSAERPTYISTSEYYGDTSFSRRRFEEAHSYYYFTIVAAIVVGLCLDFVVLLALFLPALWYANKASNSKHKDNICEVKKFGRRALVLNIIGGVLHVLFVALVAIGFITGVSVSLNS